MGGTEVRERGKARSTTRKPSKYRDYLFTFHIVLCCCWKLTVVTWESVVGLVCRVRGNSRVKSIVVSEEASTRLLEAPGRGKVAIVTGSNTGIGERTVLHLVRRGIGVVVMACRSTERGEQARMRILEELGPTLSEKCRVEVMHLDLMDLENVRKFAAAFLRRHKGRLDILVNNAGLPGMKDVTKQGYNKAFGVNFLSHWLLTYLLFPSLCATPNSRVVNLSSVMHHYTMVEQLEEEDMKAYLTSNKGYTYGLSKLAMLLFTVELRRQFQLQNATATSIAVNPGAVNSDIWRYLDRNIPSWQKTIAEWVLKGLFLTTDQGCTSSVAAATVPLEDIGYSTIYIQPYWLPYGIAPLFETLGYYVGWEKGQPTLPSDYESRATALWNTMEALLVDWSESSSMYLKSSHVETSTSPNNRAEEN